MDKNKVNTDSEKNKNLLLSKIRQIGKKVMTVVAIGFIMAGISGGAKAGRATGSFIHEKLGTTRNYNDYQTKMDTPYSAGENDEPWSERGRLQAMGDDIWSEEEFYRVWDKNEAISRTIGGITGGITGGAGAIGIIRLLGKQYYRRKQKPEKTKETKNIIDDPRPRATIIDTNEVRRRVQAEKQSRGIIQPQERLNQRKIQPPKRPTPRSI